MIHEGVTTTDKKVYMRRLSQMLERDKPCECCPCQKSFGTGNRLIDRYKGYENKLTRRFCPNLICSFCQHIVGLEWGNCPCYQGDKKKALRRAKWVVKFWQGDPKAKGIVKRWLPEVEEVVPRKP